jgi:hypothetical protein
MTMGLFISVKALGSCMLHRRRRDSIIRRRHAEVELQKPGF